MLDAARTAGVGRFVYVSSPSVAHTGTSLVGAPAGAGRADAARGNYSRSKACGNGWRSPPTAPVSRWSRCARTRCGGRAIRNSSVASSAGLVRAGWRCRRRRRRVDRHDVRRQRRRCHRRRRGSRRRVGRARLRGVERATQAGARAREPDRGGGRTGAASAPRTGGGGPRGRNRPRASVGSSSPRGRPADHQVTSPSSSRLRIGSTSAKPAGRSGGNPR